MPRHAAHESTKRGRSSVGLVIMGAVGKGAEFFDKRIVRIVSMWAANASQAGAKTKTAAFAWSPDLNS
jgi:hypothetical protein